MKEVAFSDLFAVPIRNGLFRPTYVRGEGTKMINMGEVFAHGRIGNIDMESVPLSEEERGNYLLKKDDLLFARASLAEGAGKCCIFVGTDETTFESHVIRVRLNPERADPRFYYYYFNSKAGTHLMETIVERTAASGIRASDLSKLVVPRPELEAQSRIADFLELIDRKIELIQDMNRTLQSLAGTVFKRWFVDLEFPNAEGKPYKASGGRTIFNQELQMEMPQGWSVSEVGELVSIGGGTTPRTTEPSYWDGDVNWATPKDMSSLESPILAATARRITPEGLAAIGSRTYPRGTLLMSSRAPIGYLAIAQVDTAVNQGIIAMVCQKAVSSFYMINWCKYNMEQIENRANGTTFREISKSSFRSLPFLVPPKALLSTYDSFAEPLYSKIAANEKESRTLAQLRDSLLPQFMSQAVTLPVEVR